VFRDELRGAFAAKLTRQHATHECECWSGGGRSFGD
jgi:hypothetical protein